MILKKDRERIAKILENYVDDIEARTKGTNDKIITGLWTRITEIVNRENNYKYSPKEVQRFYHK